MWNDLRPLQGATLGCTPLAITHSCHAAAGMADSPFHSGLLRARGEQGQELASARFVLCPAVAGDFGDTKPALAVRHSPEFDRL
jgi:hypothetical protein